MDIRILTLLLFVSVTGSFADLRSPLFRFRRNGLQDDRPHVMDFTGPSRMKRESSSSVKSTTVPTSTLNPAVTLSKTNSQSTSTKEPNPTTPSSESPKSDSDPSTPDSDPITTSDPESTDSTPDASSNTSETPKPRAMITPAKSATQKNRRSTPDQKSTTASLTATTASPTTEPSTPDSETTTSSPATESSTSDPESTTSSPTTTPNSKAPTITSTTPDSKAPTTKPRITPSPKDPDTKPTSVSSPTDKSTTLKPKPETSGASPTKKPTDSAKSTTATPSLASRFNPDDESKEPNKIPESNQAPNTGNPMYPGFPGFQFPPFFMPPLVPDFSSPYSPSNPYFVPNAGNSNGAWSNGDTGAATSFASASAGASAGSTNYNAPPLGYQGGYPDNLNTVNAPTAVEPTMGNVPNMFNAGGYGYGGGVPFDGGFAFPDFQRQIEENIRQMQASFQKQQQWLSDRIADGANNIPGAHSAVSSIQLGPGGGYQAGAINPAAPGVESRFANELPPPSGGSYGVFSSSSSHTMLGPDGKTVSHKSSTTGVNDNGKITFRTVED